MNGNPLNGDIHPQKVVQMMTDNSKLAAMTREELPGMGISPAAIFADIINVERADTKRLAEFHDVDMSIQMMSEERAAELMAGTVDGNGVEVLKVFNDLAEKRDKLLREVLDDDEHSEFMDAKTSAMYSEAPETFDKGD